MRHLLLLLAAALTAGLAPEAHAQLRSAVDVSLPPSGAEAAPCGTPAPTADYVARTQPALARAAADARTADALVPVPTVLHMIHDGPHGLVPDAQVEAQMDVLNAHFNAFGLDFVLVHVNRVERPEWFYDVDVFSQTEEELKRALAIDPSRFFNVYSTGTLLPVHGWAYFPDWFEDEGHHMYGAVIHHGTFPGGPEDLRDLPGWTLIHEAGHWAGLFHTFEGGCSGTGDAVDDTPAIAAPTAGCPTGRDSCPNDGQGPDMVENIMDYSTCGDAFTPGQMARSAAMMAAFRPTLAVGPAPLVVAPEAVDFGEAFVGHGQSLTVGVGSFSEGPVAITSVTTDHPAFSAAAGDAPLGMGEVGAVTVTFDPDAPGAYAATLTVTTTSPFAPTVAIPLSGEGRYAPVAALPVPGVTAHLPAGETATAGLHLANTGLGELAYALEAGSLPVWLRVDGPVVGTVAPGAAADLAFQLDTSRLPAGWNGVLQLLLPLRTNDPTFPWGFRVPVVVGVGDVLAPPLAVAPRFGAEDVAGNAALSWLPVPGATAYRVQVSTARSFGTTVVDEVAEGAGLPVALDPDTPYFWRARSVGPDGAEGPWSLPLEFATGVGAVAAEGAVVPAAFALGAPYPNPARHAVTIPLTLGAPAAVTLRVFDLTGREVAVLAEGASLGAGPHAFRWEAAAHASGVYLYRVEAGRHVASGRLVLVR